MQPAIGVPGMFASNNPYATYIPDEGGLIAGPNGLTVAAFAWVDADNRIATNAPPSGDTSAPAGFVLNDGSATISNILDEYTMTFLPGYMVTLLTAGDVYALSTTATTKGQKVFASTTDGTISTGAAGATVAGSVETAFYALNSVAAGDVAKIGTWNY